MSEISNNDTVSVSFTATAEHHISFNEYWWYKTRRGWYRRLRRGLLRGLLLALVIWVILRATWGTRNALLIAAAAFAIVFPAYLVRFRRLDRLWWKRNLSRKINPEKLNEAVTLCASPEGLAVKADRGDVSVAWHEIGEVVRDSDAIAIVLWNDQGWVIPAAAFADAEARSRFETVVDRYLNEASNSAARVQMV